VILTAKIIQKISEAIFPLLFPKLHDKIMNTMQDIIKPLHKYVNEPNELDDKTDNHEKRIKKLEAMAHEPKDFVSCAKCNGETKEKKWYDK
jgi:hypothetical protein